ncbi:hypothetical protein CcaCcLH18_03240 [Colletotrichum camelliae]|nr:hypothetical protein CcaCcLH18_03240 [Colletotrichum camelliae]
MIEELFQNVTISMASVPSLRYNKSNPFRTKDVLVTSSVYRNLHHYAPLKLWIPYGLGICATALAVLSGLLSMFTLGASFTANFSTILRISRRAHFNADSTEHGSTGEDPLPESLGRARLRTKLVAEKGSYKPINQTSDENTGSVPISSGSQVQETK